jgi:hypothetical protein
MSARDIVANTTSVTEQIFVQDATSSTGAGLSVAFGASGLVGEYRRWGQSSWTSITLVTATLGTFTSGGWIADGSLTGAVEVGLPNAAFASGVKGVTFRFYGVTNMVPVLLRYSIIALDVQNATPSVNLTKVGGTAIPTAITPGVLVVDTREVCYEGVSQNIGNTTTSTIGDGAGSATINAYNGMRLHFRAGTGSPADAIITGWDGSIFTHTAVLVPAGADTVFRVLPGIVSVQDIAAKAFACTIGLAAGSIGLANLTAGFKQMLSPRGYLISTGTESPSINGTWNEDALWNNEPTYVLAGGAYTAWIDPNNAWTISPTPGVTGISTNYWKTAVGASVTGPYTAAGTATGVPAIAYHGNAVLSGFQPASSVIGAAVLDVPTSAHVGAGTIGAAIGAAGSGSGTGSLTAIINVKDAGTAANILGATVKVSGAQAATATTDASGNVTLNLNSGTVTVSINVAGYSNYNPTTHTIDGSGHWDGGGSATLSLTMAAVVIPSPSSPNQIVGTLYTRKPDDTTQAAVVIQFQMTDPPPGEGGNDYDDTIYNVTSDSTGLVSYPFTKGAGYQYKNLKGGWVKFIAPLVGTTFPINDGLGKFAG